MISDGPLGDGRVLTGIMLAAIWGAKNVLALRQMDRQADFSGSPDAMQGLAARIGKPVLSGDLVFHPDGLVTRRA
jgi:hypothetical protein